MNIYGLAVHIWISEIILLNVGEMVLTYFEPHTFSCSYYRFSSFCYILLTMLCGLIFIKNYVLIRWVVISLVNLCQFYFTYVKHKPYICTILFCFLIHTFSLYHVLIMYVVFYSNHWKHAKAYALQFESVKVVRPYNLPKRL